MTNDVENAYKELDSELRTASVAQIGGGRPPEDKITSWFGGRGVGLKGETLPQYNGRDMFPLLQVKVGELPFIPPELENTEFLIVFFNREIFPFDNAHGDGWVVREYNSLEGLEPLPESEESPMVKEFPIIWHKVDDDAPGWENAWELVDLDSINETEGAAEKFFDDYNRYPGTKFGGFPCVIQSGAELEGFVFQIGTEEKANWMWADNGVAYFNKNQEGDWVWDCQFY